jgi:hypothetical protein
MVYAGQHRNSILWTPDSHSVYYDCRGPTVGDSGPWRGCLLSTYIAVLNLLSMILMTSSLYKTGGGVLSLNPRVTLAFNIVESEGKPRVLANTLGFRCLGIPPQKS